MGSQVRSGIHLQVLRGLADESPQALPALAEANRSTIGYVRDSLARLKRDGLVAAVYVLTDEGRNAVDFANQRGIPDERPPRRPNKRRPRKVIAHQYPLATTEEQIAEIKRKAHEDRSFGFESINQRGLTARK